MKGIILILSFLVVLVSHAQENIHLRFNSNGEFKIVQFTDTHIDLISGSNLEVYDIIRDVLQVEKPDLVVLTGDIVTQDDPQNAYQRLAGIFADFHMPWAMVFGNHESEHNFSRVQLAAFLVQLPFCMNADERSTKGDSDFILPVFTQNKKPGALLYFLDSQTYSTLKPNVEGYGWISFDQIGWYRNNSAKFTAQNEGVPLPALAFFHIPLPEYSDAWNNKIIPPVGVKNEDECSPKINTGMLAAMLESGDVMGTFVGHDHINDYIGIHHTIALAYGRITKRMKNPEDPLPGGRIIMLNESKREFISWIREFKGDKVLVCSYPGSFKAK